MILVDTCVLIDVTGEDAQWADWSSTQLATWGARGPVVINPMVFAEWSSVFPDAAAADAAVDSYGLTWHDIPHSALFLAARAHTHYRRRGGNKAMMLPDFMIGAHARFNRWPVLTRDPRRFTTYFAGLEIVHPGMSTN